jgi:hypothetical protein
VSQRT